MEINEWLNNNELSINIFNKKYRNGEETLEEFFERVSHGYEPVKQLIIDKKFIFGGRILASRGVSGRKVTYSNCYVIAPPDDNIESIFECTAKLAREEVAVLIYQNFVLMVPQYTMPVRHQVVL